MDFAKIDSDEQILVNTLPHMVWTYVFNNILFDFPTLDACSKASSFLDDLIKSTSHLSVTSRDLSLGFNCVPKSVGVVLFPDAVFPKPIITALNICVTPDSRPIIPYLEWLIQSQNDSLETLHISCLGTESKPFKLVLHRMNKLRKLKIVRHVKHVPELENEFLPSLIIPASPHLPALESLTLTAFGYDRWWDLLDQGLSAHRHLGYSTCKTVKHLRLIPSHPTYIQFASSDISCKFAFPNLVSLEIPAMLLDNINKIFLTPEGLKRLTLTLPTDGMHKHLFDVCITGYGKKVCAAILANPDRDPWDIREEIEEENERHLDNFDCCEQARIQSDIALRRKGRRLPNLTQFTGLEELRIQSNTGDWGPTLVSCRDLLNMTSLKTLQFCGHKPKYIPDAMIMKLREKFSVLTPTSNHGMDSNSKIKPLKQNPLEILPKAVWKQVFGYLSSSFQTVESCMKASDLFENLVEKAGLLSISQDKIVPSSFRNRVSFQPGVAQVPRITTLNICITSNFQPTDYYFNSLLKSQRDSIKILHISCLWKNSKTLNIKLPEMGKLRDLKLVRNSTEGYLLGRTLSLHIQDTVYLPALEALRLSAFGEDKWDDLLETPALTEDQDSTCEMVKHFQIIPGELDDVQYLIRSLSERYFFENLVSLEIPAVSWEQEVLRMFPFPENLKRLTLTLPTQGLHKHLFDLCIRGCDEKNCAAFVADRMKFERLLSLEHEDDEEENLWDNFFTCSEHRWNNIACFVGLEELCIKSNTGYWGPTLLSCDNLLSMTSLKTLRFCGPKPKYIPDPMIRKMKQQFTVLWG